MLVVIKRSLYDYTSIARTNSRSGGLLSAGPCSRLWKEIRTKLCGHFVHMRHYLFSVAWLMSSALNEMEQIERRKEGNGGGSWIGGLKGCIRIGLRQEERDRDKWGRFGKVNGVGWKRWYSQTFRSYDPLSLSLFLSVSLALSLSLYAALHSSPFSSIPLSVSLSLSLYLYDSLYLSFFFCLSLTLLLTLSLPLSPLSRSLFLSFYLSVYLSVFPSICQCGCPSMALLICVRLCFFMIFNTESHSFLAGNKGKME